MMRQSCALHLVYVGLNVTICLQFADEKKEAAAVNNKRLSLSINAKCR